jgi:hypothetical protein
MGKKKFEQLTAQPDKGRKNRKPSAKLRNEQTVKRTKLLVMRCYFFKNFFAGLSYEMIVQMLMNEFCFSELTVGRTLMNNAAEIRQLMTDKPTIEELKIQAPHYNWNVDDYLHMLKKEQT